jgi:hypothetical protein
MRNLYLESVEANDLKRMKDLGRMVSTEYSTRMVFYDLLRFGPDPSVRTRKSLYLPIFEKQHPWTDRTETEKDLDDVNLILEQLWQRILGN